MFNDDVRVQCGYIQIVAQHVFDMSSLTIQRLVICCVTFWKSCHYKFYGNKKNGKGNFPLAALESQLS